MIVDPVLEMKHVEGMAVLQMFVKVILVVQIQIVILVMFALVGYVFQAAEEIIQHSTLI